MTWNLDFAIFYVYSLVLFGALLLWAVPAVFVALATALPRIALHRSSRHPERPDRPGRPDRAATKQARMRIQGLWARFPNLIR